MSQYTLPNLNGHEVLYKGRRFIVFGVSKLFPYEDYESMGTFVIWDGKYDAIFAVGKMNPNGSYFGELAASHVQIDIAEKRTLREFLDEAVKTQERYFKDCGH